MPTRITIIGTGAIGTSLGLALRANGTNVVVIGHDKELSTAQKAQQLGAFEKVEWNLLNAIDGADLVILALPVSEIRETMRLIGPELRADAVVSDTSTIKAPVQEWGYKILPPRVHFVGGNPLVHTPGRGPSAGRVDLFKGQRYSLTPSPNTEGEAINLLTSMIGLLGAEPLFLDPAEHDSLITGVHHLPLVGNLALLGATTRHPAWREMSQMAAGNYADATRMPLDSAPEIMAVLKLDRESLLNWIESLQQELSELKSLIQEDQAEALETRIVDLLVARSRWAEKGEPDPLIAAIDEAKKHTPFGNLFGLRGLRRTKK